MAYVDRSHAELQGKAVEDWFNVLGPLGEPVNGAAVDEGGEHATPCPEGIPHRTHTYDNVQLVLYQADKVCKYAVPVSFGNAIFFSLWSGLCYHLLILISWKQVRHLRVRGQRSKCI